MPDSRPISAPADYVPEQAITFSDASGRSVTVSALSPLPTLASGVAASSTPLAGTVSASGLVGPFVPQIARDIMLALSGTWTGSVQVQRSSDGGVTTLPLTAAGLAWASFTANACEAVANDPDAAATYYLAIVINSGTLTYRISQ